MSVPRILAFAGSLRRDSFNKQLVKLAARGANAAGGDVTIIDLADFPMPLYNEDDEQTSGIPEPAARFKQLLKDHDGFLISSPEYNSSISGVLKNAIDWASRAVPGEAPLAAFKGKWAALMSASPGALGGLRGLVHIRAILGNLGVYLIPDQVAVSKAKEAFAPSGQLKDARQLESIERLGRLLVETLRKIQS